MFFQISLSTSFYTDTSQHTGHTKLGIKTSLLTMTTPIPVPPYVPLLTHAIQVDTDTPNNTFGEWARLYGEIYEIYLFSKC